MNIQYIQNIQSQYQHMVMLLIFIIKGPHLQYSLKRTYLRYSLKILQLKYHHKNILIKLLIIIILVIMF